MPITYVRAPDGYEQHDGDGPSVFLAGGITAVADWQEYAREELSRLADFPITVFNPRRDGFDLADEAVSVEQIAWEYRLLREADLVLFWFAPGSSVQPITLFELGAAAERPTRITVGADPSYARRFDVREQLRLIRPELDVHATLDDLLGEAIGVLRGYAMP